MNGAKNAEGAAGLRRYKPYPAYKDSGVEWLGEIPEHWEVKRVRDLADSLQTGPFGSQLHADEYLSGGVPVINPVNLSDGRLIPDSNCAVDDATAVRLAHHQLVADDILFARRGELGRCGLATQQQMGWLCGTGCLRLRARADLTRPRLLLRLLSTSGVREWLQLQSVGSTMQNLNTSIIGRIPVVLPTLKEQDTIAAFLDRETARIDALVAKKERLIELLQEKRTALITRAVTKGLDPNVPMKASGVEWLGEIPAHWELAPVYARYEVALGKMLDAKRVTGEFSGPYLRNVDVQWDRVNTEGLPEMDFAPWERDRYSVRPGDLLVCEGGEVGRTAIWRGEIEECFYQKALHRVRPRAKRDDPRFFFYLMYMVAKRGVFAGAGNQNTIDHLTAIQLKHYRFPFAPEAEQRAIATFLDRETSRIDALVAKVRDAIDRLKELRTALISAAVTGKIDVRGDAVLDGAQIT